MWDLLLSGKSWTQFDMAVNWPNTVQIFDYKYSGIIIRYITYGSRLQSSLPLAWQGNPEKISLSFNISSESLCYRYPEYWVGRSSGVFRNQYEEENGKTKHNKTKTLKMLIQRVREQEISFNVLKYLKSLLMERVSFNFWEFQRKREKEIHLDLESTRKIH